MSKRKTNGLSIYDIDGILQYKYLENSYKLFWLQVIVKEAIAGKKTLSYFEVAKEMVVEAWEYIAIKEITFGRLDRMVWIVTELQTTWNIPVHVSQEELRELLKGIPEKDLVFLLEDLYEETPYELLAPMYEKELKRVKDAKRKELLLALIAKDVASLYVVEEDKKQIVLRDKWANYIKQQPKQVNAWIHDRLAYFLEQSAMKRKKED